MFFYSNRSIFSSYKTTFIWMKYNKWVYCNKKQVTEVRYIPKSEISSDEGGKALEMVSMKTVKASRMVTESPIFSSA